MNSSTSSSSVERKSEAGSLLNRLGWFLLPFFVFPGIPLGIAVVAGELTPLETVVKRQLREPVLYGRAYRDDFFAFKLISTEIRRPEVLVLGSSRVMQFRASLVEPSKTFFNAGGAASSIADVLAFMRRIQTTARPSVLLLGIDQVWLTQVSRFDRQKMEVVDADTAADLQRAVRVSHRVAGDLMNGKVSLSRLVHRSDPIDHRPALGMNAIMIGSGFRPDGSYQYGPYRHNVPSLADRLREGFDRIEENVVPMVRASRISADALLQLRDVLTIARRNGIMVIGFCPPFAPTTLAAMHRSGRFAYLGEIPSTLGPLFGEFEYTFADWSDPSPLGVSDQDMIDYFHPSEEVVRRMFERLIAPALPMMGRAHYGN
jgi:hypothetical protein